MSLKFVDAVCLTMGRIKAYLQQRAEDEGHARQKPDVDSLDVAHTRKIPNDVTELERHS